jgi:hypothetical protein
VLNHVFDVGFCQLGRHQEAIFKRQSEIWEIPFKHDGVIELLLPITLDQSPLDKTSNAIGPQYLHPKRIGCRRDVERDKLTRNIVFQEKDEIITGTVVSIFLVPEVARIQVFLS